MAHADIILDMVMGSVKDEHSSTRNASSHTVHSSVPDFTNIFKVNRNQINALRTTISNLKLLLGKIITGKKRKGNMNNADSEKQCKELAVAKLENTLNSLKRSFPKHSNFFLSQSVDIHGKQLFGLEQNSVDDQYVVNNQSDKANNKMPKEPEEKGDDRYSEKESGLHLFFDSIVKSTCEFTEEEILELEIQILKMIKNIKGKRELKLHLRRYCSVSMNFKDCPLFGNDIKLP